MEATYKFRFSEDHLLAAMCKYREQIWWRRPFTKHRWSLAALAAIGLACCIYFGSVIGSGAFGGVIGATVLGWPIDAWIIRRRFRKSPYHDDEVSITLSNEGFRAIGKTTNLEVQWSTYTKAWRFRDGLLLFQGPHLFNWLPDETATEQSMVGVAEELVKAHVPDYRSA
ncbi:MAG: YcxB family protein [Candidatus Competibacteraceae bacterium]|nr:YcxB family protein [Candidatus Competibacteraceae bacterium]